MKFLVTLAFLFNLVYSADLPQFSVVNLSKYPEVKESGKNLSLDFEFEVTKDIVAKSYKDAKSHKISLLLLPPLGLKFKFESSLLTKKVDSLSSSIGEPDDTPLSVSSVLGKPKDFGKCDPESGLQLLRKLPYTDVVSFGAYKKYSLLDEIKSLPEEQFLVKIDYKGDELKKGTYTWSGYFERRQKPVLDQNLDTFGEFVVALSVGESDQFSTDLVCFAKSKLAASIMLRDISDMKSFVVSCGSFNPVLPTYQEYLTPLSHNLVLKGFHSFVEKDSSHDFVLKFTVPDEKLLKDSDYLDVVIGLPKEFIGDKFKKDICTSEGLSEVFLCKYDGETATLSYSITKSQFKPGEENSIRLNISSDYMTSLKSVNKKFDFSLSLFSKVKLPSVKEFKSDDLKKIDGYTKIFCSEELSKLNQEMMRNAFRIVEVGKSLVSLEIKDVPTLMYKIKKIESVYIMKIFLQDYVSFNAKKFFIKIEPNTPKDFDLSEPITSDKKINSLVENNGLKYDPKLSIEIDVRKLVKPVPSDKFFVIDVPFTSKAGMDKLGDPTKLKFSIEDEQSKSITPFRKIYLKTETTTGIEKFEAKEIKLTGPFFMHDKKLGRLSFNMEFTGKDKMLIHLAFKGLKGVKDIKGELDKVCQEVKVKTDKSKYVQFDFKAKGKAKLKTLVVVLFELDEKTKFEAESVEFSVVEEPTTSESFDVSKEKKVLLSQKVDLTHLQKQSFNFTPCLTEETRFSSSQFRSGDIGNYFFTRFVDCKKPWMPSPTIINTDDIDVSVSPNYGVTPSVTLKETISLLSEEQNLVKNLIKDRRFYEHTLYLFFDELAVKILKQQMIEAKLCKNSDTTCSDYRYLEALAKFAHSLFETDLPVFSSVKIAFLGPRFLEIYLVKSGSKNTVSLLREHNSFYTIDKAFELLLDYAFEDTKQEMMGSSFSVIGVMDSYNSEKLKLKMNLYDPLKWVSYNGSIKHPIYVDILPIDEKSTYKNSKNSPGSNYNLTLDKMVTLDKIEESEFQSDNELTIYTDFQFSPSKLSAIGVPESPLPEKMLKGSEEVKEVEVPFKRDDFSVFFGFRQKLPPMTYDIEEDDYPLKNYVSLAIFGASHHAATYYVIGTCSSFHSEKNAQRPQKYTITYRGVKLGEYTITAKNDMPEKLYGECDLFSLYKYFPDTPSFIARDLKRLQTLPDPIKLNKVVDAVQIISSETTHLDKEVKAVEKKKVKEQTPEDKELEKVKEVFFNVDERKGGDI